MHSSFWPWRKTTEHAIQAHFISSPEKIQNNAVCRQDSFDCFLRLTKSLHDRIFGSWEYCQFSSVHWNNKKTYGGGCVELGGQHRGFCWCVTMQDRTLLAQKLKLWRRWSFRFYPTPYSPDLAPSDFHFFPHLKRDLKGTRFTSDDEVKQAVTSWIKQRTPEFFTDGMRKLVLLWEKWIEWQGYYVEK